MAIEASGVTMSAGYLAVDLGAESGRVVLGRFDGGRVSLEEIHRFPNTTGRLPDGLHWDVLRFLFEGMDLPSRILAPIVPPATGLGPLLPEVAEEVDAGPPVFAIASHDTASAVVAVPAEGDNFAYISSGTWSLVGVETPEPVVTQEAMEAHFTNEGGFGGRTRLLKNVMGLWILQECRRQWAREGNDHSYEELAHLAEDAPPAGPLVDPDHPTFLSPETCHRASGASAKKQDKTHQKNPPPWPGACSRAWRSSTGTP
jgi:sugar (pentulose or hexulose) kinase